MEYKSYLDLDNKKREELLETVEGMYDLVELFTQLPFPERLLYIDNFEHIEKILRNDEYQKYEKSEQENILNFECVVGEFVDSTKNSKIYVNPENIEMISKELKSSHYCVEELSDCVIACNTFNTIKVIIPNENFKLYEYKISDFNGGK